MFIFPRSNVSAQRLRTASVSVFQFRLFKWETPRSVPSELLKFISESFSEKFITCTVRHYGMAGMALSTDNATYEWCKRLWVCVHVKDEFLCADSTFVHLNVLVWQVDVIVLNTFFHHFWFFISESSVMGYENDKHFMANYMINPTVKEF